MRQNLHLLIIGFENVNYSDLAHFLLLEDCSFLFSGWRGYRVLLRSADQDIARFSNFHDRQFITIQCPVNLFDIASESPPGSRLVMTKNCEEAKLTPEWAKNVIPSLLSTISLHIQP